MKRFLLFGAVAGWVLIVAGCSPKPTKGTESLHDGIEYREIARKNAKPAYDQTDGDGADVFAKVFIWPLETIGKAGESMTRNLKPSEAPASAEPPPVAQPAPQPVSE